MPRVLNIALAAITLLGCTQSSAQPMGDGEWRAFEPELSNPVLREIGFFHGEELHAEPYLTCRASSGWVKISIALPEEYNGSLEIRSARTSLDLPALTRDDLGISIEAMIPASQTIFEQMALGQRVQFGPLELVAETGEERWAIRQFIADCRND